MNKLYIKITTLVSSLMIVAIIIMGCKKGFLETSNPNVLSPVSFPTSVSDLNIELNDLYGRLRHGLHENLSGGYKRWGISIDHSGDQAYGDPEFNAACQVSFEPTNNDVDLLWNSHYENIAKAIGFIEDVNRFRAGNPNMPASDKTSLDLMEGQARFIRAWNYFILLNFFGETMINSSADAQKMGIPIIETLAGTLSETQIARSSMAKSWEYIVNDLKKAETLLNGKTWTGQDVARVSVWAVRGLLGKSYLYMQEWENAKTTLRSIIDQSGKTLVPFEKYKDMFNGLFEFNEESLFELNYTADRNNEWNNSGNVGSRLNIFIAPAFEDAQGNIQKNGFANFFVHDKNLLRFGFTGTATSPAAQKAPAYLAQSKAWRDTKIVDPRLWVVAFQPYLDSLIIDGATLPAAKNLGETFGTTNKQAWSFHKFVLRDKFVWTSGIVANANNMYILRMADIYLMYAEALKNTGDNTNALEYINKVHRRAYSQPINVPSAFDYTSLTSGTKASDPALQNDPLKYERWAELFAEAYWWFDVRRWRLGPNEASFYASVGSGNLTWSDHRYALPIPLKELNSNKAMVQNPGY